MTIYYIATYGLNETWVSQNIDNQFGKYYRKWLHAPVSANVTHLSLPNNKLGMSVKTAKLIYKKYKVTIWRVLKCSFGEEGRKLYEIMTIKNVNFDCIVNEAFSTDVPNYKTNHFQDHKVSAYWKSLIF